MKSRSQRFPKGFTLLEILIALFIFTLLSMILAQSLRNVVDALGGTENKAERLRQLQMALLVMSRDIEQVVNRPVINNSGKQDPAFIGAEHGFIFTHTGFANPTAAVAHSTLQRTGYQWQDQYLLRQAWAALDQPPKSQPHTRKLLSGVAEAHFEYFDKNGRTYTSWPLTGQGGDPLPHAIRVYLTLSKWGTLTQLYLIPAQASKAAQAAAQASQANPSSSSTTPTNTSSPSAAALEAGKEQKKEAL